LREIKSIIQVSAGAPRYSDADIAQLLAAGATLDGRLESARPE